MHIAVQFLNRRNGQWKVAEVPGCCYLRAALIHPLQLDPLAKCLVELRESSGRQQQTEFFEVARAHSIAEYMASDVVGVRPRLVYQGLLGDDLATPTSPRIPRTGRTNRHEPSPPFVNPQLRGTDDHSSIPRKPETPIHTIFEGTSEIQQLVIARAISGLRIE